MRVEKYERTDYKNYKQLNLKKSFDSGVIKVSIYMYLIGCIILGN